MSQADPNYRLPKRVHLNVACVYVDNYFKAAEKAFFVNARSMLDEHNIGLNLWPSDGAKHSHNTLRRGLDLPSWGAVPTDEDSLKLLRKRADEKIKQGGCTFIIQITFPVVFCQFGVAAGNHAETHNYIKNGNFTGLALISPTVSDHAPDKITFLHEIGHGAGLPGMPVKENFMCGCGGKNTELDPKIPRKIINRHQVETLAKAMFAVG